MNQLLKHITSRGNENSKVVALAKNSDRLKPQQPRARFARQIPTSQRFDIQIRLQVYQRARYYDCSTGEFISQDPLEYVDGISLYRGYFLPAGVDPLGRWTWDIDEANCTITMRYTIQIAYRSRWLRNEWVPGLSAGVGAPGGYARSIYDTWTAARKTTFKIGLKRSVESIFNANTYLIKPVGATCCVHLFASAGTGAPGVKYGERTEKCSCPNGFSPDVNISFVQSWADWKVYAKANSNGIFIRSRANRWYGWLDEDDVQGDGRVAAHEFGHSIGLSHPGSWVWGDEYGHSGTDFWGRPVNGRVDLMGAGTGLRPFYFDHWVNELNFNRASCCHYAIR